MYRVRCCSLCSVAGPIWSVIYILVGWMSVRMLGYNSEMCSPTSERTHRTFYIHRLWVGTKWERTFLHRTHPTAAIYTTCEELRMRDEHCDGGGRIQGRFSHVYIYYIIYSGNIFVMLTCKKKLSII